MKTVRLITFFLLILNFITLSYADDDCSANVSDYSKSGLKKRISIFDAKSSDYKKVLPSKLIKYGFVDRAILKDNMSVKYTVGGCEHFTLLFEFKSKDFKLIQGLEAIKLADSLLKKLSVTEKDKIEELQAALQNTILNLRNNSEEEKPAKDESPNGITNIPCEPALCVLDSRKLGYFRISYDFAL